MNDRTNGNGLGSGDADRAAGLSMSVEMYAQLKRLAGFHLKTHRRDLTLNCTALVHEAYLKLAASSSDTDGSDEHYASVASLAMRQILVDYVRRKKTAKHGGNTTRVTLQESSLATEDASVDLLALDEALLKLAELDPLLEQVVVMRFFGGFSTAEIATALNRSARSIERDWTRARLYLYRDLGLADVEAG